jgi:hypothetical protein
MEGITSCKTSGKLRRLAGFFAEKGGRDGLTLISRMLGGGGTLASSHKALIQEVWPTHRPKTTTRALAPLAPLSAYWTR